MLGVGTHETLCDQHQKNHEGDKYEYFQKHITLDVEVRMMPLILPLRLADHDFGSNGHTELAG